MLVLDIFFDLTYEIIHKSPWVAKVFTQKHLEFLSGKKKEALVIQILLVLLLVEIDTILKKKSCKKFVVRFFYLGGG